MTISLVKTDGSGDFSTIQAAEDACPADITAGGTNENWEMELFNEEFLDGEGSFNVGGITTDATHQLILRPVSGGGFADNANPASDALRYQPTLGASIRITTQYTQAINFGGSSSVRMDIIGIQIKTTRTLAKCIDNPNHSQPIIIDGCILESAGTGTTGNFIARIGRSTGTDSIVKNTVLIKTVAGNAVVETKFCTYDFCTFYGATSVSQVRGNYNPATFNNCLFLNSSDWQSATQDHTVDHCVGDFSSWESSTATNSVLNATASDEIENDSGSASTVDLRAKSGGSSDGGGTNISGITTDIYGQTRDGSTPTVGAFEIVSAVTAALTGTITPSSPEADIVTGGKTIILTLTGDTLVT